MEGRKWLKTSIKRINNVHRCLYVRVSSRVPCRQTYSYSLYWTGASLQMSLKVARTSFLSQGVDHHRASRVRNTSDGGARPFYQNKYGGARLKLFLPKVTFVLLETKFAYKGGFTCWNNLSQFCVFKKNCFGDQLCKTDTT